jgi:dihydroorotate dehydrogenase
MYDKLRPLLFALEPETAHKLTLYGLGVAQRSNFAHWIARPPRDLPVRVFGIDLPNPVGLAAGLDKNADHLDALAALGFGFIEVGTVTPRPQAGNPKPRMFRLPAHEALINRMGFNNAGIDALVRNVEQSAYSGVLGINVGKNRDTPNEEAVNDYRLCMRRAWPLASYLTINISSPNTKGLRDLQEEDALRRLIGQLREEQEALAGQHGARKPMLLKIAPDLEEAQMDAMAEVLVAAGVDGLICTNTTLDRSGVQGAPNAGQDGGLSGRPLRERATQVLKGMHERMGGSVPIIGVGGIVDGADAAERMHAGADLVQLYTGLIYRGPRLLGECVEEIRRQSAEASA